MTHGRMLGREGDLGDDRTDAREGGRPRFTLVGGGRTNAREGRETSATTGRMLGREGGLGSLLSAADGRMLGRGGRPRFTLVGDDRTDAREGGREASV